MPVNSRRQRTSGGISPARPHSDSCTLAFIQVGVLLPGILKRERATLVACTFTIWRQQVRVSSASRKLRDQLSSKLVDELETNFVADFDTNRSGAGINSCRGDEKACEHGAGDFAATTEHVRAALVESEATAAATSVGSAVIASVAEARTDRISSFRVETTSGANEKSKKIPAGLPLRRLSENLKALVVPGKVSRVSACSLSSLEFVRNYVSQSQPVVITDLHSCDWPCLSKWTDEYLLNAAGDTEVSVNVTPHGQGDAVDLEGRFLRPCEERMFFRDFWRRLHASRCDEVLYLSKQNDCLRQELPELFRDVPAAVPLGVDGFGNSPEAVNIWIGDSRAVSSCHLDHYENLFAVVRGEKVFTLLPPAAVPFLHECLCQSGEFARAEDGSLKAEMDPLDVPRVPWIPFDVASPDFERFPNAALAPSVEVRVGPGEMLYLPAMWYHRVGQKGLTVGVNYWHDMSFGAAYCHQSFLRDVNGLTDGNIAEETDSFV
eukprot:TRINITY_DN51186_c0_g1_i1.p1 TRINITY_DN51186_c0_g1~~TRINITY_DN51186_c0_g1_i1.p1  ORF type:complete len:511 (-),score=62.70 TRINITY_DN51186_c0_g1_i1:23-1498(-)